MAVNSTTLAGVNVWQFSGIVTDTEIKTAWSALIVNNRYKPARYIYIDSTCNLLSVRGTYHVDCEALGIILHASRNKANTLFSNWIFIQTAGLSVGARSNFVRSTNGTTITTMLNDGIDMKGGGMIYAVVGNPGGGDPRYLNEMMFGTLDGTVVTSQAYTEQELQPVSYGTIWRGLNIQKCANIPIVNQGNQVVYRTNFNTETTIANPISLYSGACGCFVSTVMRKQGATFTSSLANTFGSTGATNIMILNNWKDESYFGASKTALVVANWNAGNKFTAGVLKKIQVLPSTLIRTYDSRSTTVSQKSTFSETTSDFLSGTDSTTSDAITGRASIVCVGAIATGGSCTITRYTGQKFTLQKFGYKVQVETPDMTFGDDDLSAFSPITMTAQTGVSRIQSAIQSATIINDYQQFLEELHNLAVTQQGSASYNAYNNGNLFSFDSGVLTTNFTTVNVDATASSKIAYNSTTNTLTIKSSVLTDNPIVTRWNNTTGTINLLNGAQIKGVYSNNITTTEVVNATNGSNIVIPSNLTNWLVGSVVSGTGLVAGTVVTEILGSNVKLSNNYTGITGSASFSVSSVRTSTVLELNTPSNGYSLCVYKADGTTKYFGSNLVAGSYYVYFTPAEAGTYYFAAENYGQKRTQDTLVLSGGNVWYNVTDSEDVGITETVKATVAAYTTNSNTAHVYDVTANFRLTEIGIKLGQLVARDGTYLDFGNYNVKFKDDASAIISVSSGTITYKSIVINESTKYNAMKATPPKTILANDTELINVLIEDANGDSQINILGGLAPFNIYKFPIATTDYPVGLIPDTRMDVANFVESTSERNYRFISDPAYNYFVFSPSGRSDSNIPNNFEGQTDWEVLTKGIWEAPLFKGKEIIILEAPEITQINQKMDEVIVKIDNNLDVKVSTRLADADYEAPHNAEIDAIKAVTDTLENYDDTTLTAKVDAIQTVVDSIKTTVEDKTGYSLTTAQVESIAVAVESHLLDEGDSQQLINAIVTAIGNSNVDETILVAAIRADLERSSGSLDSILTKVNTLENYDDATVQTKLDSIQTTVDDIVVDFTPVLNAIDTLPTLPEIEAGKVGAIKTKVDTLENTDLTGIATTLDVVNAKDEIISEVGSITVDNAAIATEVWNQEPERLKQVSTVQTTGEQLESFNYG